MSKYFSSLFANKKSFAFFAALSFIFVLLLSLGSCLKDDGCKECRIQTYENNALVSSGDWVEYCGQNLTDVQGQTSTVGTMTTKMVCR